MAIKRIGPTLGAGVVIQEKEGGKQIQASALGWAGYAGILERGPTNELIVCQSKTDFEEQCGGRISYSYVPDAAFDYYDVANGAGGILFVRVTDGNEVKSSVTLYTRKTTQTALGTLRANNGGRWGGQKAKLTDELTGAGDLLETTMDTGNTMVTNEWAGGYIELVAVAGTQYPIISNTSAGVITVAADQTMKTDWGAGPSLRYYLVRENGTKYLSYEIRDGEELPDTEFGLVIYLNGNKVKVWPNLSTDPTNKRYWVDLINDDDSNYYVEAVDLWTGAHVASVRPANHYGEIDVVTATVLTAVIHEFVADSVNSGDGTVALGATTDVMDAQVITCTFSAPTTFTAVSDIHGSLGAAGTVGALFTPDNKWSPPFTLTAGATPWALNSVATITYKPFLADELIGGNVYPDKVNSSKEFYRIIDNDHSTITAAAGSDLTTAGAPGDSFMVVAAQQMDGGIDGNADIADADYNSQGWDTNNSPFNQIAGKGYGLVKFASPGVTATAVQKAGVAYADAKNHQYRYEVPSATLTESAVDTYLNDTLGRSDYAVVSFPSYGYIADPDGDGEGKLKLISLTGAIHGREARIAADYAGYHKAEAGVDATLPSVLKLTTGETILDEEYLNPKGINIIKKMSGNFVLWGDRTLWSDITWKWKHQREQMTYYEHVLAENFDWIIFAINDPVEEKRAHASMVDFFSGEYTKRALQGNSLEEAAQIKIDSELNTPAVRAAGDMKADVTLWLADTVERFIISIGKQGIFTSTI